MGRFVSARARLDYSKIGSCKPNENHALAPRLVLCLYAPAKALVLCLYAHALAPALCLHAIASHWRFTCANASAWYLEKKR